MSLSIARSNASLLTLKKMSWEEMQKHCENGLCFNYNDRFTSGHRCQVSHMFVIEAEAEGKESKTANFFSLAEGANRGRRTTNFFTCP